MGPPRYHCDMLRTLAKVIALIGAAAAVLWTMRDRFVSVATSREPEPPMFRTPPEGMSTSVTSIDGIGPTYASRLANAGIRSLDELAAATPDTVAESAGVSGARARTWIEQAREG